MRQETNIEVAAEPQPVGAKKAEAKKTDEHEDSDDDAAWWRLYRQERPWEEYSSLSKGAEGQPEAPLPEGCGRDKAGEGS